MLPPGHIAAGYLIAEAALLIGQPNLSSQEKNLILGSGALFAFLPDLDTFYAFYLARGFTIPGDKINHRFFVSHTPLPWLVAGGLIMILSGNSFTTYFGLMVWLGSWSHFVLDSFHLGIRWFHPFSHRFFALQSPGVVKPNNTKGFFAYWINFLKFYTLELRFTFLMEVAILSASLITLILRVRAS